MTAHAQGLLDRINAAPLPRVAPRVIGIDPSLTGTGVSNGQWCNTITTKGAADATLVERARRIRHIAGRVLDYTRTADLVVIEGPAPSSRSGHVWDRAGLWWRIVMRLALAETPVAVVPPNVRAKYATGKAGAGKDAVLLAAARRWPDVQITNNNEADALVLAAMGLDWLGCPLAPMPATHRAALTGVAWPTTIQTGDTTP